MARHKSHRSLLEKEPVLEIASLIDICFLLLIYFVVTSTITPRESDLAMALPVPRENSDDPLTIEPIFVRIEASGEILTGTGDGQQSMDLDTNVRELPLLRGQLEMYAAASRATGSEPMVKIDVDDLTKQQRVIDVLNAITESGIQAVTFTDLTGPAR